jgi:hypothetical protein
MASKLGIYEFNLMPFDEQANTLWDYGSCLTERLGENGIKYQLHALSDFYVEVVYDAVKNRIVEFKSFKRGERLTPYLDQLDLNELH